MIKRDFKRMVYGSKSKREVLDQGTCFGYPFVILSLGTHPTAYVKLPKWLEDVESYDEIPIKCHGGLTYLADHVIIDTNGKELDGKWMGWDYAHGTDFVGYFPFDGVRNQDTKKWTTKEIHEEVVNVCFQLMKLEEETIDKETEELIRKYQINEEDEFAKFFRGGKSDER